MKLIEIKKIDSGETWYFTNQGRAAKYIGTSSSNLTVYFAGVVKQVKGWTLKKIEADNILCKYINPERHVED